MPALEAADEDGGTPAREGEVEDWFGREALEGLEAHPVREHGRREVCRRGERPGARCGHHQRRGGCLPEEGRQTHQGEVRGGHVEEAALRGEPRRWFTGCWGRCHGGGGPRRAGYCSCG